MLVFANLLARIKFTDQTHSSICSCLHLFVLSPMLSRSRVIPVLKSACICEHQFAYCGKVLKESKVFDFSLGVYDISTRMTSTNGLTTYCQGKRRVEISPIFSVRLPELLECICNTPVSGV